MMRAKVNIKTKHKTNVLTFSENSSRILYKHSHCVASMKFALTVFLLIFSLLDFSYESFEYALLNLPSV